MNILPKASNQTNIFIEVSKQLMYFQKLQIKLTCFQRLQVKLIRFQRLQIKLIYSPAKSMRNQTFSKIDVKLASKPRKPFLFEIHPHFLVYFICFYNQCNSTFLTPPGKIDEKSNIFQNRCQIGFNTM